MTRFCSAIEIRGSVGHISDNRDVPRGNAEEGKC